MRQLFLFLGEKRRDVNLKRNGEEEEELDSLGWFFSKLHQREKREAQENLLDLENEDQTVTANRTETDEEDEQEEEKEEEEGEQERVMKKEKEIEDD